jgi:UDP-N-acetylglucosamine 3-dehydrogenase
MNNNQKIVVIGTGRMGRIHIRVLDRLGVLAGLSDIDPSAKEIAKNFGNVPFYQDYSKMVTELSPDGAIISVPTNLHFKIAKGLLENYKLKAILIEKPVCNTIEEALELKEISEKSKTKVTVGHIEVFNPVVMKMLELFKAGVIGHVRSLIFQRRGAVSDGRLDSIGDVFGDIGIHDFDIASRIISGNFKLTAHSLPHEKSNIINVSTVVLTNNDLICTFHLSREYAGKKRQVEIEGTKATMIVDLLDQYIIIRQLGIAKGDTKSISIPYGSGEHIKVYGEPLLEEIWQFLDTVQRGSNPLVTIDDGIKGLRMIELVRKASRDGRLHTINL